MAVKRVRQDLRAFNTQFDPAVLDRGDRGLWNTRQLCELIPAQLLKFANDANGFAN